MYPSPLRNKFVKKDRPFDEIATAQGCQNQSRAVMVEKETSVLTQEDESHLGKERVRKTNDVRSEQTCRSEQEKRITRSSVMKACTI